MKDFYDEFDKGIIPRKPNTPIQYVKLDDTDLVKRDLDTFPDFLKEKALDKYKLISFLEQENSGGWTQKKLDPILDKLFEGNRDKRPNWRSVVRWRKSYIDSNGDLASLVVKRHKMGNRKKRVEGDEVFFERALSRFLDAKRPKVTTAYQYYKDAIEVVN